MKQFKIAVKNYGVSFSKEGNDFTVIDSNGNSWTSFPYHLKVKAKPGETIYFQTKQRTQHAVPGRGTGWKFEQISERAYNLKTDRSILLQRRIRLLQNRRICVILYMILTS